MRVGKLFIGIDPGATGACVLLSDNRSYKPRDFDFSKADYYEFFNWLQQRIRSAKPKEIYIAVEKVHGGSFGKAVSARGMFTFGFNVGTIHGICVTTPHPVAGIAPQVWQKEFGLLRKAGKTRAKEKDYAKKKRHRLKAASLFPTAHVIQSNADAFLLALYCRRHYQELF